jgi:hypothetical protein
VVGAADDLTAIAAAPQAESYANVKSEILFAVFARVGRPRGLSAVKNPWRQAGSRVQRIPALSVIQVQNLESDLDISPRNPFARPRLVLKVPCVTSN